MKNLRTLSLFCLILITCCTGVNAQSVGTMAPDFTLEKLGGGQFKLSDHRGKVVFIFFFGYACPHCLANGPNTQTGIYDVYKNNPDFVAVGVDTWNGNASGVSNFKSSTQIEYTLCLNGSSLEQSYQTTYDRMVVLDKEGVIRYKATANATSGIVAAAKVVIDNYLDEGGMDDDDDDMGNGDVVTSTDDLQEDTQLKIFPNPATDRLTIEGFMPEVASVNIKIFDIAGKLKLETDYRNIHSNPLSMNLETLKSGTYFVQLSTADATSTHKLIVR